MKKRKRPKKAKPSIDTVDQLHEYFNKKVNQYMNEPLSKPDWNAQMAHTMMTAIYSYSQHLYNDDKPKTRLGLSEHVDRILPVHWSNCNSKTLQNKSRIRV